MSQQGIAAQQQCYQQTSGRSAHTGSARCTIITNTTDSRYLVFGNTRRRHQQKQQPQRRRRGGASGGIRSFGDCVVVLYCGSAGDGVGSFGDCVVVLECDGGCASVNTEYKSTDVWSSSWA